MSEGNYLKVRVGHIDEAGHGGCLSLSRGRSRGRDRSRCSLYDIVVGQALWLGGPCRVGSAVLAEPSELHSYGPLAVVFVLDFSENKANLQALELGSEIVSPLDPEARVRLLDGINEALKASTAVAVVVCDDDVLPAGPGPLFIRPNIVPELLGHIAGLAVVLGKVEGHNDHVLSGPSLAFLDLHDLAMMATDLDGGVFPSCLGVVVVVGFKHSFSFLSEKTKM